MIVVMRPQWILQGWILDMKQPSKNVVACVFFLIAIFIFELCVKV